MAWRATSQPAHGRRRSWLVYGGIILFSSAWLVQMPASRPALAAGQEAKPAAEAPRPAPSIELNTPLEGELAGGQSQVYQLALAAGQYVKLVIDQRGIDVALKLSGTDGKQLAEFNADSRPQGQEIVFWAAEQEERYRLEVQASLKDAPAGKYELRMTERRAATADDRALVEAYKLVMAFVQLTRAGKFDEARPVIERALEIRELVLGPDHPEVGRAVGYLAGIYRNKGEFAKAEPLYLRSLQILEKSLEPDHLDLASTLGNLANLYVGKGDFTQAESLYLRAQEIQEKVLGPDHPTVARTIGSLATLYRFKGDFTRAESMQKRALNIAEKSLGPDSPGVADYLNSLANIYNLKQEYDKAEPLYLRSLQIREKSLGPDHPDLAASYNNLAALYISQGEYAKAEPLYQRTLKIWEQRLGPEHPNVATALNNLAHLYQDTEDYARAEELFQRALAIREKTLAPNHPEIAVALSDQAVFYAQKGDLARAVSVLRRANLISERNLASNLAAGSERQKLAYLSSFSRQTDFTISLHSQLAPDDPEALNLALTTLLRRKGRGLDAITDTVATLRRHATPQDRQLFDQLAENRAQLAELSLKDAGAAKSGAERAQIAGLEEKAEKLEAALSARSGRYRAQTQPVTISAVQTLIPAGTALIEFAVYTPAQLRTATSADPPQRYVGYLLTRQGPPKWVDLGEAAPIDQAVTAWRQALRVSTRTDVDQLGRALDEKVMQPLRVMMRSGPEEIRRLLIAPDGALNLIPFAALVNEQNRYLVESYAISYLASGRDLLRLQSESPNQNPSLIVANPAFGRVATVIAQADLNRGNRRSRNRSRNPGRLQIDSSQVFFQPLPGTEEEALAIKAALPGAALLLRKEATETALKQIQAPRILHIATHGFFFDEQMTSLETRDPSARKPAAASNLRLSKWAAQVENPLLRSGLALAGANQGGNGDDDGVLTALEAAGLDLLGTKLVVLSACDTGVGEVKNGEGVQGLRRALVLAGSESQIMSLWPVPDDTTPGLMAPYYRALQQGQGRGEALRQVQLRMLRSRDQRHPCYWAAFIQSGEWANLDGRR
ncbi:MAG TPA: CHAT domain-containing tetratricopeptide repeat protein [Blastocatellia bacterium]|nr:CHAT domain-containing tetratricopeptide repeat protein [Blastocatellia bacterium]